MKAFDARTGAPRPSPRIPDAMDTSLNPALADARFCPRCGQAADISYPRRISCALCGYELYFNPKPVAGVIPFDEDGNVILLRRGFEPGRGLWTFPGGFVDLGESTEVALRDAFPARD